MSGGNHLERRRFPDADVSSKANRRAQQRDMLPSTQADARSIFCNSMVAKWTKKDTTLVIFYSYCFQLMYNQSIMDGISADRDTFEVMKALSNRAQ